MQLIGEGAQLAPAPMAQGLAGLIASAIAAAHGRAPPATEEEKAEFGGIDIHVAGADFNEEREYIVDPALLTGFEIVERLDDASVAPRSTSR